MNNEHRTPIALIRTTQVKPIIAGLERLGLPLPDLLRSTDFLIEGLEHPDYCHTAISLGKLLRHAARLGSMPDLGFMVAKHVPALPTFVIDPAAPSVKAALQSFCEGQKTQANLAEYALLPVLNGVWFCRTSTNPWRIGEWVVEQYALATMSKLVGQLAGIPDWHPAQMTLSGVNRTNALKGFRYYDSLSVSISPERNFAAVFIPQPLLDAPVAGALPSLTRAPGPRLDSIGLLDSVQLLMRQAIVEGDLDQTFIARQLGVSRRTLQRRFSDSGVSFRALEQQVKFERARRLLLETSRPVENIGGAIGFSNAAHFIRAFKIWSGLTPARYRRKYARSDLPGDITAPQGSS